MAGRVADHHLLRHAAARVEEELVARRLQMPRAQLQGAGVAEYDLRVEAVVPPAPSTFSITIVCPSVRDMFSATMRETLSGLVRMIVLG